MTSSRRSRTWRAAHYVGLVRDVDDSAPGTRRWWFDLVAGGLCVAGLYAIARATGVVS